MLNLDSIKIEVRKVDISGFVNGLTLYESIFGMMQGQIAVQYGKLLYGWNN
jgi:flagellar motor switch protein FliM